MQVDEGNTTATTRFPCYWKNGDPLQGKATEADCTELGGNFGDTAGPNSKMEAGITFGHKCSWAEDCSGIDQFQCAVDNGDGSLSVFYSDESSVIAGSPGPLAEINERGVELTTSTGKITAFKEKAYGNGRGA